MPAPTTSSTTWPAGCGSGSLGECESSRPGRELGQAAHRSSSTSAAVGMSSAHPSAGCDERRLPHSRTERPLERPAGEQPVAESASESVPALRGRSGPRPDGRHDARCHGRRRERAVGSELARPAAPDPDIEQRPRRRSVGSRSPTSTATSSALPTDDGRVVERLPVARRRFLARRPERLPEVEIEHGVAGRPRARSASSVAERLGSAERPVPVAQKHAARTISSRGSAGLIVRSGAVGSR